MKKISRLENHIVVCGAGRVGKEVVAGLLKEKVNFVVVDFEPQARRNLPVRGCAHRPGRRGQPVQPRDQSHGQQAIALKTNPAVYRLIV